MLDPTVLKVNRLEEFGCKVEPVYKEKSSQAFGSRGGPKPSTKRKPHFASYGLAGQGGAYGCSVQSRRLRLLLRVHRQ
jgi:hypothetical protein